MRRVVFVTFVSSLLVTFVFVQRGNIPVVRASSSIHQGDLVLTGNNVTTIEDRRFDINGSIIVEENATLILRNAVVNFTQVENYQFNMTFRNPANGNPRLVVENATITSSHYALDVMFFGNSSASANKLAMEDVFLYLRHSSVVSISNSTMYRIYPLDYSVVSISNSILFGANAQHVSSLSIFNCTLSYVMSKDESSVDLSNSTITREVYTGGFSMNCSINGLQPCFVGYWNFELNCSVAVAPGGKTPNLTLTETQVNGWTFELEGISNATISHSELVDIYVRHSSTASVYDSLFSSRVLSYESSSTHIYNSTIDQLYPWNTCKVWLVNSTTNTYTIMDQSRVYVCWYLDVHVVDSIGQDVPSANVTATYPNTTVAEWRLTNTNGWARLTLPEKMMNATGEYPVGNYTAEATYESHSDTTIVNMTENKQITLTLEDFIIPEFPSLIILPLFMMATLLAVIVYRRKHPI